MRRLLEKNSDESKKLAFKQTTICVLIGNLTLFIFQDRSNIAHR